MRKEKTEWGSRGTSTW